MRRAEISASCSDEKKMGRKGDTLFMTLAALNLTDGLKFNHKLRECCNENMPAIPIKDIIIHHHTI